MTTRKGECLTFLSVLNIQRNLERLPGVRGAGWLPPGPRLLAIGLMGFGANLRGSFSLTLQGTGEGAAGP